jgi:hypothetical protein
MWSTTLPQGPRVHYISPSPLEIDSGDDAEVVPLPLKEMIKMCRILEENSMVVCTEGALELIKALRQYRTHLQRMSREGERQTTLDDFFHF